MRRATLALAAVLAAGLALPGAAHAGNPPLERLMMLEAGGTLEVAPDGSVANVTVEDGIEAQLAAALSNSVRRLHFAPVLVDGRPVRALTGFTAVLVGREEGGRFSIAFDGIQFQTPSGMQAQPVDGPQIDIRSRTMNPPKYPRDEMRGGRMGMVKLAIRVAPDGSAAEVAAVDSYLYDLNVGKNQGATALRHLEQASIEAAKQWSFAVPASAAQLGPREMTVATSIVFTLVDDQDLGKHGQWLVVHRGAKRPIAWLPPAASQALVDTALAAGGTSNGGGALQLLAPIGGTPVF